MLQEVNALPGEDDLGAAAGGSRSRSGKKGPRSSKHKKRKKK
jgi:hypothetical protein